MALAERSFEAVLQGARALGDPGLGARATNNLAMVAQLRGKQMLAISLYGSALAEWRAAGDSAGEAQTSHNLATLHLNEGEVEGEESLNLIESLSAPIRCVSFLAGVVLRLHRCR